MTQNLALHVSILSLALLPFNHSSLEQRHGTATFAQLPYAAYTPHGWPVYLRDATARSDCLENVPPTSSEYPCAACVDRDDSQCTPVRAIYAAIIDGESRDYLSREEGTTIGNAVGSVECQDKDDSNVWYTSTGYLVAANVIKIAGHGLYKKEKGVDGIKRRKKAFDPTIACEFNLRDWETGKVSTYRFKQVAQCPGFSAITGPESCDWAIVQLTRPVPRTVKPLELAIASDSALVGKSVTAVGHHLGVELGGQSVNPASKLIDTGVVKAKPPGSRLFRIRHMFPYTADTGNISSGQPVLVKLDGRFVVVGSHSGEFDLDNKIKGKWDDNRFFNYAELINSQMIEQVKHFALPAEKSRFETVRTTVLR
jgi:hypothetical protein